MIKTIQYHRHMLTETQVAQVDTNPLLSLLLVTKIKAGSTNPNHTDITFCLRSQRLMELKTS